MNTQPAHSVLIVEDERVIAKDIQQILQGMGYDAFAIASSAEEALAQVSERCPDLVLMDIRIEGPHDGVEAAQLLSALHDVPVIFLSAHSDEATVDRAKKVGPYAFLSKPVKPADLRGAIETSLYRQSMDKRLRERERWFATTLDCVADAVVTTDLSGRVTFLNPAAAALLGVNAEQSIGRPVDDIMHLLDQQPHSGDATPLSATLRLGKSLRLLHAQLINLSTGEQASISDTSSPVMVDGKMAGAVMVFRDDTEKMALARQLEISDRLAALGTMAAGTAHELNNPLAIITSRVENALESLHRHGVAIEARTRHEALISQLREISLSLGDVQTAAGRMARIIAELRSISRPQTHASQVLDMASCIDWAARATAHEFRNRARVEQRLGPTPPVLADEARVGQVLVNLLVNAAHAIAPGDVARNEVIIATRTDESGRAVISIRDTGQGMAPDVLKRIFDPFFTTKDVGAGTGLGLAVSHGIVRSLGGQLRAESTPGVGSNFEIVLPPAPASAAVDTVSAAVEPAVQAAPLQQGRVLVVDDEEMLLRAITQILEADGFAVATSSSALEALAMLARGERFDAILSDISMPDMTGMEFHEALRKRDERLAQRMIFMSGGAITREAEQFLNGQAQRYIAKPFKSEHLRQSLRQVLATP